MNDNNSNNKNGKKFLTGITLLSTGILIGASISILLGNFNSIKHNYAKKIELNLPHSDINSGEPTDLPPYSINSEEHMDNLTYIPNNKNDFKFTLINKNIYISLEEAKEIALDAVGNGSIISYEQDLYDDDKAKYSFKILKNNLIYKVKINALDGTILKIKIDD